LWQGSPIGIPFVVVNGDEPARPATFLYDDESDPGGYRVPLDAPIEGGPQSDGDRHAIALDRDNCILYELYRAFPQPDGSWRADSGAIFDLRAHWLRPAGWTSADAAGLPILTGLVRYEEVAAGEIRHAIRFTAPQTRRAYVWPARHYASRLTEARYPPMGQRFRLRADFDISGFSQEAQVILRALKKYGMILADNGSAWYISGAPDERWDNDALRDLRRVRGADFEAVDVSSLMVLPDSGITATGAASQAVVNAANYRAGAVSPGLIVSLFGPGIGPDEPAVFELGPDGRVGTELAGVTVRFGGLAAPLLYVSTAQINAIVPYAVTGPKTEVEVFYRGASVFRRTVSVVEAAPGVFQPVLNQDYSPNSPTNPAERGSIAVVFGTGEGATDPLGIDGQPALEIFPRPVLPGKVEVAGRPVEILYAGAAPQLVAGVFQVNFRVPEDVPAGAVPLRVSVGPYQTSPRLRLHVR
ncbi:MAG TPA: hypothetical protein ENJ62_05590, partial [Bryobacterales bacterium]|nr:hypothetical protein [Bryobacterales bacterium]